MSAPLAEVLRHVGPWLDELGVGWALVGGLAVSARVEPRFTRDIDLAVAVGDDAEAEQVVRDLAARGAAVESIVEQDATGRLGMVRVRLPQHPDIVVDLRFASSGIEPDIVAAAERLEILSSVVVPVARLGHLVATKLLSTEPGRPQDAVDLATMRAVVDTAEHGRAAEALRAIDERGYARQRDLQTALDRWWAEAP